MRLGATRLVAFERNIDYQMSEDLKQAGGDEAVEAPVKLEAKLTQAAHVYDLRTERYLGYGERFEFTLDAWEPTLLAVSQVKLTEKGLVAWLGSEGR